MAIRDLHPARPAGDAIEEAHHRGRHHPEGDSHAGPHPDPRAPLGVTPALARSEENGFPHVCLKCEE